ncbi:hypothetical protein CBS101457_002122 [Exobasidium rhododendri]|nr:hypothetical protein CBS101457_002122 [Exobasidium rhododendri]
MSSEQVSNDEFLAKLVQLFESSSSAHSVFINHKRVASDGSSDQWPVVFRATDGKGGANSGRTKFSTHVDPKDVLSFQDKYSAILRSSLTGFLRKRDKAKERRVDKLLKERRKRMEEETDKAKVTAVGSSRGSGRRKRAQAKAKATKWRQEKKRVSKAAKQSAAGTTAGTAGEP